MRKLSKLDESNSFTVVNGDDDFIHIEEKIIEEFNKLICTLETDDEIIVCTRGDSRESIEKFFNVEYMKKFFVVGQKADTTKLRQPANQIYSHTEELDKTALLKDIKQLIEAINKIISEIDESHNINGSISQDFIDQIDTLDINILMKLKMIFISFLHNKREKTFKSESPFLSLTNGENKFSKAKDFALRNKNKNGYIFLYSLNKKRFSSNYIVTKDFTKLLKNMGIEWYPDIHQEIMLLNGMYPHFILGIYEIKNEDIKNFYMNPELYLLLKEKKIFNKNEGLPINQNNFEQLAKELGHEKFFFVHGTRTYISDLTSNMIQKTIDIKL